MKEDFVGLSPPSTQATKFKAYPFIVIPPFLWSCVMSSTEKSPEALFIRMNKCIKDFVDENKEVDELKSISKTTCGNIYKFLWAASKELFPSAKILSSGDNEEVSKWCDDCHSICISKVISPPSPEKDCLSEVLEASRLLSTEPPTSTSSESSDKKGFMKLDKAVRNMILNTLSSNSEIQAGAPCPACENFFRQSSHGSAKLSFIRSMKYDYGALVDVSTEVITSLFNGGFAWSHEDSPSNFSLFSFPERKIFARNATTDCIILQLKETSGKDLSNEDVKEALKQGVEIPASIESIKYSFQNTIAAAKIFFGENSFLSISLSNVYNHIVKYRTIYRSILYQDKMFISQFMFAIDTRINLWLESCEEKEFREDIDDELIDFTEELQKVRTRNFSHILPLSFRASFLPLVI